MQYSKIFNIFRILCHIKYYAYTVSVTNLLFLNKIINIVKNRISNYFLFLLISLSLYLIILPIILFKFSAYLFFIGYFITSIVQGASSAYIGSIFNTSIPSEYAEYLIYREFKRIVKQINRNNISRRLCYAIYRNYTIICYYNICSFPFIYFLLF